MIMSYCRSLCLIAALALAIPSLAGCRKTDGNAPAAAAQQSSLARIRQQGVLRWGADPSGGAPFVYFDPNDPNKIIGFEVDMMDKLAAHMGVKHEIVRGDWAGLLDNMLARRTDLVVNGIEINEERKKRLLFSEPYYIYEQQLTVRVEDKDKYKSLDDLKGKPISTLNAAEANNVLKSAGFTDDLIHPYDDSLTPYNEVELKRVEACLQESIIAAFYAGRNPKLYVVPQTFSSGVYGIAFRKEDADLKDEVNRALAEMKANGELAEIYKNWGILTEKQTELGTARKPPAK
ncbi:MAG TPA: transporter substrate-binding domain-containing protein [Candidatus Brocadiia bacterium]|nr:transporter substrate-binding domain-containing protein [Candidatus Brocadiia bacterium]